MTKEIRMCAQKKHNSRITLAFFEHFNYVYNFELTTLLAKELEVHVYSDENLIIPGVRVHSEARSTRRLTDLLRPRRLRKPLTQGKIFLDLIFRRYDLVQVNKVHHTIDVLPLKKIGKIPYIFVTQYCPSHQLEFPDRPELARVRVAHANFPTAASNAACVVTVSKYDQKLVEKEYNVKSTVIHNGVNIQEFNPTISGERIRREHEINGPLILCVARLAPMKDPLTLIQAIPHVIKEHPNAKFMIIGRGMLKESVLKKVKSLRLQDSVISIDYVEYQNLNEYYAASDVFVLPSVYEPFGMVVLEAMASNKPVILSNIPSFRELFSDCSLFFEKSNPEDLAEKILRLLSNKELAVKLSEKGLDKARTNFTWDVAAKKYLKLYKQVLRL